MYHIKRDGGWLCGLDRRYPYLAKKEKRNYITFSQAHKVAWSNVNFCSCPDCRKRYYEILSKLKQPIITNL